MILKIIKKVSALFIMIFFVSIIFFITSFNDANATFSTPTCASGDGCLAGCSPADLDCDPSTCSIKGSGGLIPCGKSCDDPDTTGWKETRPCDLCSLFLMGQLIIEFMVKLSGAAAMIAISIGGFLYVFAAGSQSSIEKAKSMIKYTLLGFVIVFIAWAIVDSILTSAGYIDPIGGDWYTMECTR
ncbi:MAG: pilin [Minisyncoccia bacterium]